MYPTISFWLESWFGVHIPLPIQTYGFFVAMAFIAAGYVMSIELKRKEKEGKIKVIKKKELKGLPATPKELIFSFLFAFVIGYKLVDAIFNWTAFSNNPQDFILSWKGNVWGGLLLGALSAFLNYKEKAKQKLEKPVWQEHTIHPYQLTGNLLVLGAIFGLAGTKIFHNLENIDDFMRDPIGSIFSFSGLSFFGGLIVGGIALVWYASKNQIRPLHFMDSCAPAMPIGYGIGRLGCHISGDGCWGIPNPAPNPYAWLPDWLWSYNFPHNVVNDGSKIADCMGTHCHKLDVPVYPTSLYEFGMMMIAFAIIILLRKKLKVAGMMFSAYIICQGIERMMIERIRVNPDYHVEGLAFTQAEFISVMLMTAGVVGLFLLYKFRERLKNY